MSIYNDSRQYIDDPEVYDEWKREVSWEARMDGLEYEHDNDFDFNEEEEE